MGPKGYSKNPFKSSFNNGRTSQGANKGPYGNAGPNQS